ncbi:MAG: BREX-1 system phosphatase PglZ type B [Planctomycetota bacterium]
MSSSASRTLLDALVAQLRAGRGSADGLAEPSAILWTDPERQWASLRPMLRASLPELVELGEYAPRERQGPAIWLRCIVDRTLSEPALPPDRPPILYLPGVARQHLRAGEETSPSLRPLVELMYRGTLFLQKGGHDWSVSAFLSSPQGLGLDVARDRETQAALLRALPEVAPAPIESLRGRRLEAEDFDRLKTTDVVRDLLRWMAAPGEARERLGEQGWPAFCNQCRSRFDFDPETEDATVAGERLGSGDKRWSDLWTRFEEAPAAFPGIAELLRRSKPASVLVFDRSRWPDENDKAEEETRANLGDLEGLPHDEACAAVLKLEEEHGERREWVWAGLGSSPLAVVLKPLALLARQARSAPGGSTPDEIARTYEERGWIADAAAWRAVALSSTRDEELIAEVVQTLLEPWLEDSARAFQRAVEARPLPNRAQAELVSVEEGGCVLFVDGLRFDLGCELARRLGARGLRVQIGRRWTALPTVTATAKPAVAPVADEIAGGQMPADFAPAAATDGRPVGAASLRALVERRGYQILGGGPSDWPASDGARGWAETGQIDELGHQLGGRLARQIEPELKHLVERVETLLEGGWKAVRIVTDHGWLLLPGGLPKVNLPKHLTARRWARCAAIAGRAEMSVPTFPWHWNGAQRFATAPGIACFNAEVEYAHGGVSIQECLLPDLLVEPGREAVARAAIKSVRWQGMRCFFTVETGGASFRAELRHERPNGTPVAKSKLVNARGETHLLVEDDGYERAELVLVLLGSDGTILAQRKTKVGASS